MSLAPFKRILADTLTISRFFAAALVWITLDSDAAGAEKIALFAFLAGSLTDYWDGRLARAAGGHSSFGRVVDPLADKALTLAAFAGLAARGFIAPWIVWLIVARDGVVTWRRFRVSGSAEGGAARESGKWKTFFQMSYLIAVLVYLVIGGVAADSSATTALIHWGAVAIAALTLWSGVRFLAARPAAAQKKS